MKILLTGDIHVGRASSSVPNDDRTPFLAASAWGRIVDVAIAENVTAILVSGDMVEQSNRYFEARGPIEAGLARLTEMGIRTVAVSGNHDFSVLPQLADEFAARGLAFELLGRNGVWSNTRIEAAGESLSVVGWSFPRSDVREDPVANFPAQSLGESAVIGVVHGDLGVTSSKYAPLQESVLTNVPVDGWLLGHIHAPKLRAAAGAPWILYPGSPQALDPGEAGVHGVWIISVSGRTVTAPELIPLSSVRYERHSVTVSGCTDQSSIRTAIDRSLQALVDGAQNAGGEYLTNLVVDLDVHGETQAATYVQETLDEIKEFAASGSIDVHVRSSSNSTAMPIDLDALTGGKGLAGLLARVIVDLEAGRMDGPESQLLMRRVLPLRDSIRLQSTVTHGDMERPATLDENFFQAEALKAARTLLATIAEPKSQCGNP